MSKEARPAMLFYGRDFYDDMNVLAMDYAEQGMYIRLCWLCWTEGSVPDDAEALANILRVPDATAFRQRSFGKLRKCFTSKDHQLIHPKVEKIRSEVTAFKERKAAAGKKGADARWHRDDSAMPLPLAD